MQQIRAITFDLDDTLWEIAPVIQRAEAELWSWLGRNCPAIAERFSAEAAREIREQIIAEHWDRTHDFRFLRKLALRHMLDACGYPDDLIDDAFNVFDIERNKVELFPDVVPALEALTKHFTVIAVTNGNANLQTIGIRHLFSDVVTAVQTGAAKPARRIFDEAVARAGVSAAETLHVGDHPEIDIVGAKRAGLCTAWINRHGLTWPAHLSQPDVTVTRVDELHGILQGTVDNRPVERIR